MEPWRWTSCSRRGGPPCRPTPGGAGWRASTCCWAVAAHPRRRPPRSAIFICPSSGLQGLGYTRRASKEVARQSDGWFPALHPAGDSSEHRDHRLGRLARAFDLCQMVEGRLRHRLSRIRLCPPAPRSAGPDRRSHRAGSRSADRPLRPARQGAARQQHGGRQAGARTIPTRPPMLGVPASTGPVGGRGRGDRARGGPRAPGSRARSVDERAPGDRAGRADRLQPRPVADHRRLDLLT